MRHTQIFIILFSVVICLPIYVIAATSATPVEGGEVIKINKKCVGTADAKDKTKNIRFGKCEFVSVISQVNGEKIILDCDPHECDKARVKSKYVEQTNNFNDEEKVRCIKFIREKGKIKCVTEDNEVATKNPKTPLKFADAAVDSNENQAPKKPTPIFDNEPAFPGMREIQLKDGTTCSGFSCLKNPAYLKQFCPDFGKHSKTCAAS